MPKRKPKRHGPLLIGIMQGEAGTIHWGPFGDIDEVIAWCERHNTQVSVIPLVDPAEDPWNIIKGRWDS